MDVGLARPAIGDTLPPRAHEPVRADAGRAITPSYGFFFAAGPQVQVVLQKLPQQEPARFIQMFFQLGMGPRGRSFA